MKDTDPWPEKTEVRSLSPKASGCIRFGSRVRMCLFQYIRPTKQANLGQLEGGVQGAHGIFGLPGPDQA